MGTCTSASYPSPAGTRVGSAGHVAGTSFPPHTVEKCRNHPEVAVATHLVANCSPAP